MKIIAAIQILIKLFTIGYGTGAVRTTERFTAPAAAGKRVDTCGFYPLNSRFPLFPNLAQTRDRLTASKWGTAEDFFYRRRAQCAPISLPLRSVRFRSATQAVSSTQARHNSVAQLVGRVIADGTCGFQLITNFTVGCDDLGAPYLTIDTRYPVGEHIVLPRNVKSNGS